MAAEKRLQGQLDYLKKMAMRGGPEPDEYEELSTVFVNIMSILRAEDYPEEEILKVARSLDGVYSPETMQGLVILKPHGYAGDFELIDRIYQRRISPKRHLAKWDHYALSRRSNQAVRHRKDYFINMLSSLTSQTSDNSCFRVLNISSGPARDVLEFLEGHADLDVQIDCLDQNQKAIDYASSLCARHMDRASFIKANVFRFSSPVPYSLVWSAGLFDYLDDRLFCFLFKRLYSMVKESGKIVIGNFSPTNPDQDYMEFAGWKLNCRTPGQLARLVTPLIGNDRHYIESEKHGINLFLHVEKSSH